MKLALTATALCVAVAALSASAPASATDYKMYHGSDCKVFGATPWTDLHFSGFGVKNLANAPRNIICPLIKDTYALWDGDAGVPVNAAQVHFHVEAGEVNSSSSCTVYVTDNNQSATFNSYAEPTGAIPSGSNYNFTIVGLNSLDTDQDDQKAYILCTLGPKARLTGYHLYEPGGTE